MHLPPGANLSAAIHSGDLSDYGSIQDYAKTIQLLNSLPAPLKLVIPGNHDLTLDAMFWAKHATEAGRDLHDQAKELWTGKSAKDAGIVLLGNGRHEFILGNGGRLRVYASSSTPKQKGVEEWAFRYISHHDIYNPPGSGISYATPTGTSSTILKTRDREDEGEVDVLISHEPPKYRLDMTEQGESIGCLHLFRAVRRVRPKVCAFGHCHAGFGAEVVRWEKGRGERLPEDDDVEDGIGSVRR